MNVINMLMDKLAGEMQGETLDVYPIICESSVISQMALRFMNSPFEEVDLDKVDKVIYKLSVLAKGMVEQCQLEYVDEISKSVQRLAAIRQSVKDKETQNA